MFKNMDFVSLTFVSLVTSGGSDLKRGGARSGLSSNGLLVHTSMY
jgi:hypothetical protein